MKIKLILFFMLLLKNFNFLGQQSEDHLRNELLDNIMKIWTKVDIVRAINTDQFQKNIFLEDLINVSLDTYYLSRYIKKAFPHSNTEFDQDMMSLIISVQRSFEEVFVSASDIANFNACSVVFKKILEMLKVPENIKTDISS